MAASTIKYIDYRPLFFPSLKYYRNGIRIENGTEFKVDEKELPYFLRQKNGKNNCFEEVKNVKRPARENVNIENVEVSE